MLIEFSVSNFRSFREKQTLTMVAAPKLKKGGNVFQPEVVGEKFNLLKVAVIYGPNASGKSNFLKALDVISLIAIRSPTTEISLPVAPFCFDSALLDQPSLFEVHFIHEGLRYQFDLAATAERIVTERLVMFPKGKETLVYERHHSVSGDKYAFGSIEGSKTLIETWQQLTSPKVLFISQAVANSSEELNQLRKPLNWLRKSIFSLLNGMDEMARAAQRLVKKDVGHGEDIASFLREVDVAISNITIESISGLADILTAPKNEAALSRLAIAAQSRTKTTLTHQTALGSANISFEDESDGTKNLIGFWLPWTTKEPGDDSSRCVLSIDELDSSLHPKIVAALVAKHLQAATPSQLIFTTHDTHLMDAKLLRRDQFWITERNINGATQLRSIYEFEGREGEDIEKRYYEGRYRGLPLVTAD